MPDAPANRRLKRYGIGAGIVALAIVAIGIGTRVNADHQLAAVAEESAVPTVTVVRPGKADASAGLVLPGDVQAYNSAAIFARTNGYVRRWLADIGDRVRAGQTLAILDAPEVDQQLAQAQADYQTAAANQALARTTAVRWDTMLAKDAVSKQEADEKRGDLAAKTALARAQSANVRRLSALQGFTQLKAPFAGVVTSRSAQLGALVVSGTAGAQPLFTVSDVHRVRIYVRVPQGYSAQVHPGTHAAVTVPEYPGRQFDAVLTRSAGAVEGNSGSVLVELQTDNGDGALKPGSYAQVRFPLQAAGTLTLPASALMVREEGTAVATVDAAGRVEIATGLTGGERVVDSPADAISNGDRVRIEAAPAQKAGS
jgi:RND family efflux transporter MFP subunit